MSLSNIVFLVIASSPHLSLRWWLSVFWGKGTVMHGVSRLMLAGTAHPHPPSCLPTPCSPSSKCLRQGRWTLVFYVLKTISCVFCMLCKVPFYGRYFPLLQDLHFPELLLFFFTCCTLLCLFFLSYLLMSLHTSFQASWLSILPDALQQTQAWAIQGSHQTGNLWSWADSGQWPAAAPRDCWWGAAAAAASGTREPAGCIPKGGGCGQLRSVSGPGGILPRRWSFKT